MLQGPRVYQLCVRMQADSDSMCTCTWHVDGPRICHSTGQATAKGDFTNSVVRMSLESKATYSKLSNFSSMVNDALESLSSPDSTR